MGETSREAPTAHDTRRPPAAGAPNRGSGREGQAELDGQLPVVVALLDQGSPGSLRPHRGQLRPPVGPKASLAGTLARERRTTVPLTGAS